jgi:hypothetical protein
MSLTIAQKTALEQALEHLFKHLPSSPDALATKAQQFNRVFNHALGKDFLYTIRPRLEKDESLEQYQTYLDYHQFACRVRYPQLYFSQLETLNPTGDTTIAEVQYYMLAYTLYQLQEKLEHPEQSELTSLSQKPDVSQEQITQWIEQLKWSFQSRLVHSNQTLLVTAKEGRCTQEIIALVATGSLSIDQVIALSPTSIQLIKENPSLLQENKRLAPSVVLWGGVIAKSLIAFYDAKSADVNEIALLKSQISSVTARENLSEKDILIGSLPLLLKHIKKTLAESRNIPQEEVPFYRSICDIINRAEFTAIATNSFDCWLSAFHDVCHLAFKTSFTLTSANTVLSQCLFNRPNTDSNANGARGFCRTLSLLSKVTDLELAKFALASSIESHSKIALR